MSKKKQAKETPGYEPIRKALKNPQLSREALLLIQGWLLDPKKKETKEAFLRELFEDEFSFRSNPSSAAYRSLRAVLPRVGQQQRFYKSPVWMHAYWSAAAAAALFIMSGMFYTIQNKTHSSAHQRDTTTELVVVHGARGVDLPEISALPCGSTVWLRGKSRISYDEYRFAYGSKREVQLSGEAYFEVAALVGKPFTVDLGDCKIHVRGTEFNVKAPEHGTVKEIMLVRGLIEVEKADGETIVLHPLDRLLYDAATGTTDLIRSGSGGTYACANGVLILDNVKLTEALSAVARHFDLEIVFTGSPDPERLVRTMVSREQSPDDIFAMIQEVVSGFEYQLKENKIHITS